MEPHERVVRMAQRGIPPRQIAADLQMQVNTVYCAIRRARQRGADIPRFTGAGVPPGRYHHLRIELPDELRPALEAEAAARGDTPSQLMRRVLAVVLRDGLIGAILDDGIDAAAADGGADG